MAFIEPAVPLIHTHTVLQIHIPYSGYFLQGANFCVLHNGIGENYAHESLPCMHMHVHPHCMNNKPVNRFCNVKKFTAVKNTHYHANETDQLQCGGKQAGNFILLLTLS